ncbi:DUF6273 domain-containing protein [Bacillus cereus group sp. BfR-BA-01380]|uniref:DUF6273 domain-containing protein n=1 Tax=Bacillus cereus group sp. BfR-BA-01380 TaxID=2920324 RepID=UPI001F58BBEE|nr:DUF6273 domain-containing protein [Bacillus cereus group sp. BfR-BA-01380]
MKNDNLAITPHRSAKPSEIITFGTYPQTANGTDRTPIKWRVLYNSGKELFILSEFILDSKRYHSKYVDVAWHDSDLRKWLNEEFYDAAFNEHEKQFINTTHCTDHGSLDTKDKIFILSVAEIKEFTDKLSEDSSKAKRSAIGTEFSKTKKSDGCHLYVYDKKLKYDYITKNGKEFGCSWWWLRTQPDNNQSRTYFIGTRSSIRSYGNVNLACYGVRPALKINLQ